MYKLPSIAFVANSAGNSPELYSSFNATEPIIPPSQLERRRFPVGKNHSTLAFGSLFGFSFSPRPEFSPPPTPTEPIIPPSQLERRRFPVGKNHSTLAFGSLFGFSFSTPPLPGTAWFAMAA